MALTTRDLTTVNKGIKMAKEFLELRQKLRQLNELYDSAGGVKSTITQNNLDTETGLMGITKAQIEDGMYAITTTVPAAMDAALAALAQLAFRAPE